MHKSAAYLTFLLALSNLAPTAQADTAVGVATTSATVQPAGPRTGTNGTNFLNVEGSSNGTAGSLASYGVIDFSVSAFNLAFPATAVSSALSLALTESNAAFTKPFGGLNFYLTTDTATSIAAGASPLTFQLPNTPEGLGTQLATTYLLGSGTFSDSSGNVNSGRIDTYTLTLSSEAQTYFLTQLNTTGAILRLIITPTDAAGASTWVGGTNATTSSRPTLSFNVTLDQPTLIWVGGSGTWNAANGTDWSGGAWDSTKTAAFNSGTGTVTLGTPVTATGIIFNTTGYTVAGTGTNTLTLSASTGGNIVNVANAADTATISAEIAGTAGLAKNGAGTLVLTAANTFTGDVSINGGVLAVGADTALGSPANGIVLNTGTLKSTTALTVGAGRTLTGSGTIDASAGAITLNGPVAASALTIAANGAVTFAGSSAAFTTAALGAGSTLTISAPVTSPARTTFTGDGIANLTGDNSSFSNGFQMNKGSGTVGPTVVLGSATALGTGQLFLNAGTLSAISALTGPNAIATSVSYGGSATLSGADMEFVGGFAFFGSTPKSLTVNNHTTISTDLGAAAYSTLVKLGTGTLTLTSFNSYTGGTQISGGILEVSVGGSLGTGDITLTPTTGTTTLRLDSEISLDDTSNIFLSSNGSFFGVLDLNFNSLLSETVNSLTVNGVPLAPNTYNAANLPDYITGTGNLIVTTAVPEPQVALLLLAGGILLAFRPIRSRFRRMVNL